ncbi:ABC transporter permease subunit [Eubacterium aggregans]|uniref:ABC transporter permease subunit n=1 Tax=Eubacterium aggregans TaxID=81409 RepID=UPI003F391538
MDILSCLVINVLEEGFIYGVMAMGVYITYTVLGFPDLSVDGTFHLGMCTAAVLITLGVNPWVACILAFIAGCVTGFLNVRLGITDLLSGILVMTELWSVNTWPSPGARQ